MKRVIGVIMWLVYYGLWPIWYLVLRSSTRVRVLIVCEDQYLLVKGWLGNDWSLPGGGVHGHEESHTSALREVREELGISLNPKDLIELGSGVQRYKGMTYRFIAYGARLSKKPAIRLSKIELKEARWQPLKSTAILHQPATKFALDNWLSINNRDTL